MSVAARRRFEVLAGLCGVVGPIVLVASFVMNPSPPPGLSPAAVLAWAASREGWMLLGGWMQGIGSLLIVIFSLALVELGDGASGFAGRLAQLAGATILAVSLIEVTFYLAAGQAIAAGDQELGFISAGLIKAVQHVFLIAPALLIPLGVVIVRTRVLGPAFAYSGLAIGVTLQVLGLAGVFRALQPVVDAILIVQSFWFVAAGAALALGASKAGWRPQTA